MQTLNDQVTKDMKTISTKLVGLKKIVKKMSVKSWLIVGSFAFVTVGLLVALYATRLSSENRSGATGGGPQFYFSPASAVLTKDATTGVLQPVQNIQVNLTVGRPMVSYSFVMKLTYADGTTPVPPEVWNQVTFVPNQKFVTNQSQLLEIPGTKLFAGTIGQQPGGITTLASAVSNGTLGSFRFEPVADQPDLRMSFFVVPNKPQANAAYVLGRLLNPPAADGEVVIPQSDMNNQFNLHNPFLVVGSPTPVPQGAIVKKATLQYAVSNGAEWRQLDARFNDFNNGGTVKSLIRLADIDPSWRVEGLSPAFRFRIKNTQGDYRIVVGTQRTDVLVNFTSNGTLAEGTFWANWKVEEEAGVKYIKNAGTTNKIRFETGDTIEVTINLRKEQNGVSYTCKETDELVVAPIGRPEEQQVMGPCVNDSLVTVTYGAGLAPGTCQCDLGVVMESACATGTVATCTSQMACACQPVAATATLTPTPQFGPLNCEAPQGFTATAPNGGSCNGDGTMTINYSWTPVSGATTYDLMISTSPDFSSGTYTWTGITTASVTKNITSPNLPRYHRVRVSAKSGCTVPGAWSTRANTGTCTVPVGATATPTTTQQAFRCPVIHTTLEAMSVNAPLPATGTNESFANFTISSGMAPHIVAKWS